MLKDYINNKDKDNINNNNDINNNYIKDKID